MSLYICNTAQNLENTLRCFLDSLGKDDVILLIEDAVFQALGKHTLTASICALKEDLIARGIEDKIHSDIKTVDYAGFVELSEEHERIISV